MKPQTEWDISAQTDTEENIHYNEDYRCILLHIETGEMPDRCLEGAAEHIVQLFNFWQTIYKIFRYKSERRCDVFMIQLESFLHDDDKDKRAQVSPGLIFCFTFPKVEFDVHFEEAGVATLALANGFLDPSEVFASDNNWADLEKSLEQFNPVLGSSNTTKKKLKKVKLTPGMHTCLTTESLDTAIKRYHLHEFQWSKDNHQNSERDWDMRARMFRPYHLFEFSSRLETVYKDLLLYARWKSGNKMSTGMKGTFRNFQKAVKELNEMEIYDDVLQRHLNLYQWEESVKKGYNLDLKDYIAWNLSDEHVLKIDGFFLKNKFYERLIDEELILEGSRKKRGIEASEPPTKRQKLQARSVALNRMNKKCKDNVTNRSDFELRYPTLSAIHKTLNTLPDEGDITSYFITDHNSEFMLKIYTNHMNSNSDKCGRARKNQYRYMDALNEIFENGHLNSVSGEYASPMCLWRTAGVEPHQDMMVQQFLAMGKVTSILQLNVEFCMSLMANIVGFTTKDNKPTIVLTGPPGAGKSHTAKAAGMIITGTGECVNREAFDREDYTTIRSLIASRADEYDRVSGTRFIEEWRGGDGNENRFSGDISMEATTLKNIWDNGMVKSERCIKIDKSDKIGSVTDVALNDRSMIILANGFPACTSLTDRFLIYDVPDLKVKHRSLDNNKTKKMLDAKRLTHHFSFMRFHISEAINRSSIGLEIKEKAIHEDLDEYEKLLTFERMDQVLHEMGYKWKLTTRTKTQITHFADVFSRWRAVMEVYGYSHKKTDMSFLRQLEHDKYNLGTLSDEELAKMVEKRSVLDPSDLLSAATMVLKFGNHTHEVLQIMCCHLIDPTCIAVEDGVLYMKLTSSLKQMCEKLKQRSCSLLPQTINECLSDLEEMNSDAGTPLIKRSSCPSISNDRFNLYVDAHTAAVNYCEKETAKVERCTTFMVEQLVTKNRLHWNKPLSWKEGTLNTTDGRLVFSVPEDLVRTFHFLCHISRGERIEYMAGNNFAVPVDFGQLRQRVAQRLLTSHMCHKYNEGDILQTDDKGYFSVPVTSELRCLFSYRTSATPLVETASKPVQCGDRQIHVSIFTPEYNEYDAVREKILVDNLSAGQMAFSEYFPVHGISVEGNCKSEKTPSFIVQEENQLLVHYMSLDCFPMIHGKFPQKESKVRTFVRKTLCKDMTDMSTILVFDRERCHETQKREDAFFFQENCPDEEFWDNIDCEFPVSFNKKRRFGDSRVSFVAGHRYNKLAYKELLCNGKLNGLTPKERNEAVYLQAKDQSFQRLQEPPLFESSSMDLSFHSLFLQSKSNTTISVSYLVVYLF